MGLFGGGDSRGLRERGREVRCERERAKKSHVVGSGDARLCSLTRTYFFVHTHTYHI
jgi:hypothetical protein